MELVKDIYFNTDKLIENTNVKVSYTGKFYQGNNEKVYLHYGYGKNWNNLNEIEMKKTDLGYQAELKLIEEDTLNFCFKNQNNEWDNNFGKNYVFNIEKKTIVPDSKTKENNIIFLNKAFGKKEKNQTDLIYGNTALKSDISTEGQRFNIITPSYENGTITGVSGFSKTPVEKNNNTFSNTPVNNSTTLNNSFLNNNFTNNNFSNNTNKITNIETGKSVNNYVNSEFNQISSNIKNSQNIVSNGVFVNSTYSVNSAVKQPETALTIAPTGFNYWTKKIKETVCKFFAYVPKLISGNYKRNLSDNSKNK